MPPAWGRCSKARSPTTGSSSSATASRTSISGTRRTRGRRAPACRRAGGRARPAHAGGGRDLDRVGQRRSRPRRSWTSGSASACRPESESYTLHRLWLNQQDIHQYYYGYANQFLWPLCHLRPALTRTRAKYWERYVAVNRRFADAVLDEVADQGGGAAVWFQDYHLALAPLSRVKRGRTSRSPTSGTYRFRRSRSSGRVSHGAELLRGLLANDVVGFHLPLFCDNFLRCAESLMPMASRGLGPARGRAGRPPLPRARVPDLHRRRRVPRGRAAAGTRRAADQAAARALRTRRRLLGLGVDRIDYSKGLEEKLKALDILFDVHPEFRERFTLRADRRAEPDRHRHLRLAEREARARRLVDQRPVRHGRVAARPPAQGIAAGGAAGAVLPRGRHLHGELAAGRHEPRRQGVHRRAGRRARRRARAVEVRRRGGRAGRRVEINPYDPEATARRCCATRC
jgi:hypothetical protein